MSLDRPFLLCGWDPYGRPITTKHYHDHDIALHVLQLLRARGFRITMIPTTHETRLRATDTTVVVGGPWRPQT